MKLLKFSKFLEEVQELNLVELGKPATKDQSRGDVLISKIRKGEELTTTNNKSVVVKKMKSGDDWVEPEDAIDNLTNNDNSYDLEKGKKYFTKPRGAKFNYVPVFKANGEELRLNQIKKTKDFGSKGAGVRTQKFETIQCIFLAIKQSYNVDLNSEDDSFKEFFLKYVQDLATRPEESPNIFLPKKVKVDYELLEEFLDDKAWIKTFCDVSNTLWNSPFINPNLKYHIFHPSYIGDSSPYTAIENRYKEFSKEEKFTDINISKYCPADVYLIEIKSHQKIVKKIKSIKTIDPSEAKPGEPYRGIEILSKVMNEYFDARTLIPISLKKIVDGYKVITNDDIKTNPPEFFIKTFQFGKDLKGIGSKISTTSIWQDKEGRPVDSKDRTINFDSSDTGKNVDVDGEIEGSSSRHGKISFKAITRLLTKWCTLARITMNIQSHNELKNYTNEQLLEMVNKLIATVNELKDPQDGEIIQVRSVSRGTDIQNSKNKLISRLQSMQIVYTIYLLRDVKHALAQRAITSIMRYALSIETDKFKSPRYLRII